MILLKHASKSRRSGQRSDDDFDMFDGEQHSLHVVEMAVPPGRRGRELSMVRLKQAQAMGCAK